MSSFIENINKIAQNLDAIIEASSLFNEESIPLLEEMTKLDLADAMADLKKGNFVGNRKTDIDLALNKSGITEDMSVADAILVWTDTTTTVYYSGLSATFSDGTVIEVPFVNDDPTPLAINISNHGSLVQQMLSNTAFVDKLTDTSIFDDVGGMTGSLVRISDVIGVSSNLEKIQLHASSGNYISAEPVYFWAKTTSAFQTLAMRAGDIISLGDNIESIVTLSNRIAEMLELQVALPELVDKTDSIYERRVELLELYTQITTLVALYDDIKVGGTNYINTLAEPIYKAAVESVATDIVKGAGSNTATDSAILNALINAGIALTQASISTDKAVVATEQAGISTDKALIATEQASIATTKSDEIKAITALAQSLVAGSPASVSYNPTTGEFTFGIPAGLKGDKGDNFVVNSVGLESDKSIYDTQQKSFSFLAIDTALIYFKLSDTSADWSVGSPFGKGEKGDIGIGITTIAKTATASEVDTYTITFTDATTTTFDITNGSVTSVAGRTGAVTLTKEDVGLNLVDNVSDLSKPISTAQQTALNAKSAIADIIDNLTTVDTTKPLSANQGKVLKGLIDTINTLLVSDDTALDELQELVTFIKLNKSILDTLGISNIAGLVDALALKASTEYVDTITYKIDRPTKTSPSSITVDGILMTLVSPVAGTDYYFSKVAIQTAKDADTIGGFHYGLTAETEALYAGAVNKTEADMVETRGINAHTIWTLWFRPVSVRPEGKWLAENMKWVDIYKTDEDYAIRGFSSCFALDGVTPAKIAGGTTDYGRAIPKIPLVYGGDGTINYGKYTWFQAAEIAAASGMEMISYSEFPTYAFGVDEGKSSLTDSYETVAGNIEHYPHLTSKRGGEQMAGTQWGWGKDVGGNRDEGSTAWAWNDIADGRGQIYALHANHITAVLLGGDRAGGVNAGSRASSWDHFVWLSYWYIGSRFACDHIELV